MTFEAFNHWAVIVAAVASFVFGGVWYGVFSGPWMAAANVTPETMRQGHSGGAVAAPYVIAFAAQLVMALFLAGLMAHFGAAHATIKDGLLTGGSVWLGFVMSPMVVNHVFQRAKPALTLIDGGHWLGVLLLQGAIIGYFAGAN